MIDFHYARLEEKEEIDSILKEASQMGCEYSFTNLYAWVENYDTEIAVEDGSLFVEYADGVYLLPAGGDLRAAVLKLRQLADEHGYSFIIVCMSRENADLLEQTFPGEYDIRADRDGSDYIYDIEKMSTLAGRKLSKKRNHIHHFEERYPDWTFEPLNAENMAECYEMDDKWYQHELDLGSTPSLKGDNTALRRCMAKYDELGLDGGLLRVEGQVVAFTIGSLLPQGEVFCTHFEKAFASVDGAYPMINREFCKYIHEKYPAVKYVNREDDLGLEGLRQAKSSYYPEILLEKFSAVPKNR